MDIKFIALKNDFITINGFELFRIEKDKIYNFNQLGAAASSRLLNKKAIKKIGE